jgi:hypothetical protein
MGEFASACVGVLLIASVFVALAGCYRAFRSGDKVGRMLGLSPLLLLASGIVIVPFLGGYVVSNYLGTSPLLERALSVFMALLVLGAGVRGAMLFRRYGPGRDPAKERPIERARPRRRSS